MPLSNTSALLLSDQALLKALVEDDPKRIQLAKRMEFHPIAGNRLSVPRVTNASLGTAVWDGGGTSISDTSATPTNPNASFPLKLLVSAFKANFTAEFDMSDQVDQIEVQTIAAVTRVYYKFWETVNIGDNSARPEEFDGLRRLVTTGQTLTARGGAGGIPALRELDQLLGLIRTNGGRPHVLYTSRKGLEAIKRAHYRAQVAPETILTSVPGAGGEPVMVRVPAFEGIPILVDDLVPSDETANGYTSIYALVLGKEGLYGVVPAGYETRMIRAEKTLVDGFGQESWVVWWPVGLALEAATGVARLQQVG